MNKNVYKTKKSGRVPFSKAEITVTVNKTLKVAKQILACLERDSIDFTRGCRR